MTENGLKENVEFFQGKRRFTPRKTMSYTLKLNYFCGANPFKFFQGMKSAFTSFTDT